MGETTSKPAEKQKSMQSRPLTPLGRRLQEIRARIVASGQPLLSREEVEREVAERQGSRDVTRA